MGKHIYWWTDGCCNDWSSGTSWTFDSLFREELQNGTRTYATDCITIIWKCFLLIYGNIPFLRLGIFLSDFWEKHLTKYNCEYYKEESNQTSDDINVTVNKPLIRLKPEIIVIDKKKIKQCPSCKCATRKEWLTVTYNNNGEYIKNQLTSYHCDRCQSSYIADTLFRTYTSHKNIDKIDVIFIQK